MSDISRRSIIKTTAWTVPAITAATVAPAFATSTEVPPSVCVAGLIIRRKDGKKETFTAYINSNQFPVNNVTAVTVKVGRKQAYEFRFKGGAWTYESNKRIFFEQDYEMVYHFGRKGKVSSCVSFVSGDPTPGPKPDKKCKKHGKKNCKKC